MKKTIFNINWDTNSTGIRKLEIDYFHNINSNINSSETGRVVYSPVDGSLNKTTTALFVARKRLIKLITIWNEILNSGLFIEDLSNASYKMVGANAGLSETTLVPNVLFGNRIITDYLFMKMVASNNAGYTGFDFSSASIFERTREFLIAVSKLQNGLEAGQSITGTIIDNSFTFSSQIKLKNFINSHFVTNNNFVAIIEKLVNVLKEIISEQKLATECLYSFNDFTFGTTQGRNNIINLKSLNVLYKPYDEVKHPTSILYQDSIDKDLLYYQFATPITIQTSTVKNVLVDTSNFTLSAITNSNLFDLMVPKYIPCTIFESSVPSTFRTQFIDWDNENDHPYVMSYNSSAYIYIPDSIKDPTTLGTLAEQPSNQLNISAFFWEIGTANKLDSAYKSSADIKLKISKPLIEVDRLDFFDNLSLILKIN